MKNLTTIFLSILFLSITFYAGCKDTITSDDVNKIIIPDSNVSYSEHIQPVLNVYCSTSGCHDGTSSSAYSFTTWGNLIGAPDAVYPGNPDTSHLVWVLEGKLPNHPYLYYSPTPNQIQGIKTWIKEGAKNN
ncbi:MAG TPA: hypothetical protein VKA26_03505 [Ignavibacteriaceae bacterium]|nr:hypothetical protein [Ignavibacteriaceae bacterium]